jgi:hypothetical protein
MDGPSTGQTTGLKAPGRTDGDEVGGEQGWGGKGTRCRLGLLRSGRACCCGWK